jgi:cyclic pyranopterin monophosphate synthase
MRDITRKTITLRQAKAVGVVLCQPATIELIKNDQLPKGDLLNIAKAAGFLAAKNTHNLIPHCHPVSIDAMNISYEYLEGGTAPESLEHLSGKYGVVIYCDAKSIAKTGIEMEVLTAVSVAALTIYDLLKPVDKEIEIASTKLLSKSGGKTDRLRFYKKSYTCAILVCSDSTSAGHREDKSGAKIRELLEPFGATISDFQIVPDDKAVIQNAINGWVEKGIQFIFSTGGTGLGPRDVTVQAVKEIIEKEAVGIAEAMRDHGGMRTPMAMFSSAVAGMKNETMIVTLPGSTKGVEECLDAILPTIFHANEIVKGGGH